MEWSMKLSGRICGRKEPRAQGEDTGDPDPKPDSPTHRHVISGIFVCLFSFLGHHYNSECMEGRKGLC